MSWREASGRESCNSCRRIPPQGEDVYRGERTPAIWCKGCAEERGYGGTGDPVERVEAMSSAANVLMQGLEALRRKARVDPGRSWHETEGE